MARASISRSDKPSKLRMIASPEFPLDLPRVAPRYRARTARSSSQRRSPCQPRSARLDGKNAPPRVIVLSGLNSPRMSTVVAQLPSLDRFNRIVVKVGSSLLVDGALGAVRRAWLKALASDIAALHERGANVIVVSSGAIALGRSVAGLPNGA